MPLIIWICERSKYLSAVKVEFAMLLAGLIVMVFTLRPAVFSDGAFRYSVVEAMLNGVKIPSILYSLVQPFLSMPIAYLAVLLNADPMQYVAYFNFCVFLILGFTICLQLCRMYSCQLAVRFLLVLLSASMLPHHLQHYFGEVLSSLCIVAGSIFLINKKRLLAIILIGVGAANTPVMMAPVSFTVLAMLVMRSIEREYVLTLLSAFGLALLIMALEMYLKFGLSQHPYLVSKGFQTVLPYSGKPGFSYPLFFGVMSILFSFGKGLLFYIPGLILLFNSVILEKLRFDKLAVSILLVFCVTMILVYGKWWSWYGGSFWGPRFFLILVFPASIALAAFFDQKAQFKPMLSATYSLIFILSVWVAVDGYIFGQKDMDVCWVNNFQLEFLCWYVPEFSALWRPFVSGLPHFGEPRWLFVIWQSIVLVYFLIKVINRDFRSVNTQENIRSESV